MRISKRSLIHFLIILPCIIPPGIYQIPIFSSWARLKYVSFLFVVFMLIGNKYIVKNKLLNSFFLFCGVIFLLTITRTTQLMDCISIIVDILTPVLWISRIVINKDYKTLSWLKNYLFILIALNFILALLMPGGIYHSETLNNPVFLLGDKNKVIGYMLPALAILLLNGKKRDLKKTRLVLYILCFGACLIIQSTTSLLVLGLFIFMVEINSNITFFKKIISFRMLMLCVIVVTLLIVTGDLSTNPMWQAFAEYLGRSSNFSGRGTLWSQATLRIKESYLFGYGVTNDVYRNFSFNTRIGILEGFSTHNGYLRILLEGGIVALLSYILIFVRLSKKCIKVWRESLNVNILAFAIISMLIVFIMEAEYFTTLFLIVIMLCWFECESGKCEENNK